MVIHTWKKDKQTAEKASVTWKTILKPPSLSQIENHKCFSIVRGGGIPPRTAGLPVKFPEELKEFPGLSPRNPKGIPEGEAPVTAR